MKRDTQTLFSLLGIANYTRRHEAEVQKFIDSDSKDVASLLNKLGGWDFSDLSKAETWLNLPKA